MVQAQRLTASFPAPPSRRYQRSSAGPVLIKVARQRLACVSAEMTCSAAVTAGWVIAASSAPVTAWRFARLRLARMIRRGSRPGCCRAGDRRGSCGRFGLASAA